MSSAATPSSVDGSDDGFSIWSAFMPAELLAKIFGYLKAKDKISAALACKNWQAAVYVPGVWMKTIVRMKTMRLTELTISRLVDCGVRRVKIQRTPRQTKEFDLAKRIGQLVTAMTDIEHLDVYEYSRLSGDSLVRAIQPTRLNFETSEPGEVGAAYR